LKTGNEKYLVPYTQKELSRAIEVDQSLVSRALCGRSVLTPDGQEKPLKFFFPSKKNIRMDIIREIIRSEKRPLTDNAIKALLKEKYDIDVSRRTVNACRKEM
jgi:RNA polymerase sigma-54 factor